MQQFTLWCFISFCTAAKQDNRKYVMKRVYLVKQRSFQVPNTKYTHTKE